MRRSRLPFSLLIAAALLLAAGLAFQGLSGRGSLSGLAAPPVQEATPAPDLSIPNDTCLGCHRNPELNMELGNGEVWSLYVAENLYSQSVHGEQGYACVQCHTGVGDYPHPPFEAASIRDAQLQLYPLCSRCHSAQFSQNQDGVHADALAEGKTNAAICADCHTEHNTRRLTAPGPDRAYLPGTRQWVPQICANCHFAIYQEYAQSVHGVALMDEDNPDVPTCTDCHGVHNIPDPTTNEFRLRSPEICADCHTDPEVMDKYGISTNVLETYVADFHGTTTTLFARQHPDQEVNTPVCYDCHGVHNIPATDDPERGLEIRDNLLARCQVCHPDATENFPTAWLSHYIPSRENYPVVFWVNVFYRIFIPTVLGGMALLVVMDLGSLRRTRRREEKAEQEAAQRAAGRVERPPVEMIGNVLVVPAPGDEPRRVEDTPPDAPPDTPPQPGEPDGSEEPRP